LILPFIEQDALFKQWRMDLASQDPGNQAVVTQRLVSLLCPSDNTRIPLTMPNGIGWQMARANYGANGGVGRLGSHSFGNPTPINGWYENLPLRRGIMNARYQSAYQVGRAMAEILDGTSNTIVATELVMSINPTDDTFGVWALGGANIITAY